MHRPSWTAEFKDEVQSSERQTMQAAVAKRKATRANSRGERRPEKGRRALCQTVWVKYALTRAYRKNLRLLSLRRVFNVHRSGYRVWLHEPLSPRAKVNQARTPKIQEFHDQSVGV